jgi:peptide/nickel transport system substrate-binding protein
MILKENDMKTFQKVVVLVMAVMVVLLLGSVKAEALNNEQLTIGTVQEFETLNPINMQMVMTSYIVAMVSPNISSYNADWEKYCSACVELPSFENGKARLKNEGGKKVLYADWEIHPKATWGDGNPVTGHDVKLSWQIGISPNVSVAEKEWYTRIDEIIIDKANPKKFTVKYKTPVYNFDYWSVFGLVPAHLEGPVWEKTKDKPLAYDKQTKFVTDPTNPGLYYGAYLVDEVKLGSHVVLIKNPKFFGPEAKIKKIVIKLVPDTASLEASLLSGSIDMIGEVGIKMDQALSLEKRIKKDSQLSQRFKLVYEQGMTYEHIDLNFRNPVLQDKRVRQALVYAIDRDKLVDALFEGKQPKAIHDTHPKDVYYTDDVKLYPHDPKKAAALLDEAGWKMGSDGVREKDGKKLSLTIMTTAQDKSRELVEVFLQQEWKKVGIDMKIKNEPARVFFGETIHKGTYPALAMFAWSTSPDNPQRAVWHSESIPTAENSYSGYNSGAWRNKVVDEVFDNLYEEMDVEKRKAMMKRALQEYTEEVPTIPLYNRSDIAVIPAKMKGFELTGHQHQSSDKAYEWDLGN